MLSAGVSEKQPQAVTRPWSRGKMQEGRRPVAPVQVAGEGHARLHQTPDRRQPPPQTHHYREKHGKCPQEGPASEL